MSDEEGETTPSEDEENDLEAEVIEESPELVFEGHQASLEDHSGKASEDRSTRGSSSDSEAEDE